MNNDEMIEAITLFGERKLIAKSKFVVRVSAYMVIIENDEVLLLQHKVSGKLGMPGGAVETGETFSEAMLREASEEIGINEGIEISDLVDVAENFFYYDPTDQAFDFKIICYKARVPDISKIHDVGDADEGNPTWYKISELRENQFGELKNGSFLEIIKKAQSI